MPRRLHLWTSATLAAWLALPAAALAASPLEGTWAGEQFRLVIDAHGGRFESGCAVGTLSAPPVPAADGHFTATGTFERLSPGSAPQRVHEGDGARTAPAGARFAGEVDHERMTLSIQPEGEAQAQVVHLQRGAKTRLIRCQ